MFKLLKRDLFQELLCLKFLIKLMRYYGRADLKIGELGGMVETRHTTQVRMTLFLKTG